MAFMAPAVEDLFIVTFVVVVVGPLLYVKVSVLKGRKSRFGIDDTFTQRP
jgi:hypothetical protein